MLLPAILLWNTRIRWSKKLALMGLFSLSAVTIVAAIVRAAVVNASKGPNGGRDASLWWFLSAVESSVGTCLILVAPLLLLLQPLLLSSEFHRITNVNQKKKLSWYAADLLSHSFSPRRLRSQSTLRRRQPCACGRAFGIPGSGSELMGMPVYLN